MNNNIYKLVWNKQINSLVPVSELAKSKSKQSSHNSNQKNISKPQILGLFVSSLLGGGLAPAFAEENECSKIEYESFDMHSNNVELACHTTYNIPKEKIFIANSGEKLRIARGFNILVEADEAEFFAITKDGKIGHVNFTLANNTSFTLFSKNSIFFGKDKDGKNSKGLGYLQIGEKEGEGKGAKLIIAGGLVNGNSNDGNPENYSATNGVGVRAYYDEGYQDEDNNPKPIILNLEKGSLIKSTDNGLEVYVTANDNVYIRNAGNIVAGVGAVERVTNDDPFTGSGIKIASKKGAVIDLVGGKIEAMYGIDIVDTSTTAYTLKAGKTEIISDYPFISSIPLIDGHDINLEGDITLTARTDNGVMGKDFTIGMTKNALVRLNLNDGTTININGYKELERSLVFNGLGTINFGKGLASETTIKHSEVLKDFEGTANILEGYTVKLLQSAEEINNTWHLGKDATLSFDLENGISIGEKIKWKKGDETATLSFDFAKGPAKTVTFTQKFAKEFPGFVHLNPNTQLLLGDGTSMLVAKLKGEGALYIKGKVEDKVSLKNISDFEGKVDIADGKTAVVNSSAKEVTWYTNTSGIVNFVDVKEGNLGSDFNGKGTVQLTGSNMTLKSGTLTNFKGTFNLEPATKEVPNETPKITESSLTLKGFSKIENNITGTGKLTVDSINGSAFSVGDKLKDFKGILALKNNTYTLDDNVKALKLEMSQGNITTVGSIEGGTVAGLAFNGGTLVFDSKTSQKITVGAGNISVIGGDKDEIAVDLIKGTLKLTNANEISVPGIEPGGSYTADSLMSIDEGETVQSVVIGNLAGPSTASNITLVGDDDKGFTSDKEVTIKQGGEEIAKGKFGLSLSSQNSKNTSETGLFVNYSLTEVDVHEGKNIVLASSDASSTLSLKNDLSAKITGEGGITVSLKDKDHVVSISNMGNDYKGETHIKSGTLYVGQNAKTGKGDTIISTEGTLRSAGIVGGNLINNGVVEIAQMAYAENTARAFYANPSLTLRVENNVENNGTIYLDRNNLGTKNTLSIKGDLKNAGAIYLSNKRSALAGDTLFVEGNYISQVGSVIYLSAMVAGDQDRIKVAKNVIREGEGTTTLYVAESVGILDSVGSEADNKITLIEVTGTSQEGAFALGNDVFLGSNQYLLSAEDNNWVLTSYITPSDPVDPSKPIVEPKPIFRVDLGNYIANIESIVKSQLASIGNQGGGGTGAGGLDRNNRFDNSVWTTSSYNQMKGNQTSSEQIDFDYKYYAMNVGADHQLSLSNGQGGRVGLMVGTSKSDTTSENKITHSESTGTVKGTMFGIYGSWYLEKENNLSPFIDVTLTYDQYKNTVQTKGNPSSRYNSNITSFSLQGGYPVLIAPNLVLEPQAQVSYISYSADEFIDHAGTKIKLDLKGNAVGRIGAYLYPEQGYIKPYAGLNIWFDNTQTEVSFNNQTFKSKDNNGFAYEGKVGVTGNVTTNLNVTGELNYRKNADKSDKWGANVSLKYQF